MRKLFLLMIVLTVLLLGEATLSTPAAHASAVSAQVEAAHTHAALACPPTVSLGSRGSAVVLLQNDLNAFAAFNLTVDGIFGPKTRDAVIAFQEALRIRVDGIVGPQTWHFLGAC